VKLKNELCQLLPSSPSTNQHQTWLPLFSKGLLPQNSKSADQNQKISYSGATDPKIGPELGLQIANFLFWDREISVLTDYSPLLTTSAVPTCNNLRSANWNSSQLHCSTT
jgi:hypothetical protein